MAVANYCSEKGHYPPAFVLGPDGKPWHSWRVFMLPYINEEKLFEQYRFDEPWDGPNNSKLAERMPKIFALHGEWNKANTTTNYLAVVGPKTAWPEASTITDKDVSDGLASTILLVENRGANVHWMEPRDLRFAEMDFALHSPYGISSKYDDPAIVLMNGTVCRLKPTLTPDVLRALLTIKGGETLRKGGQNGWEFLQDGRMRDRLKE